MVEFRAVSTGPLSPARTRFELRRNGDLRRAQADDPPVPGASHGADPAADAAVGSTALLAAVLERNGVGRPIFHFDFDDRLLGLHAAELMHHCDCILAVRQP